MPDLPPQSHWLEQAQANWATLTKVAVWILSIIGGFLIPPPLGVYQHEDKIWLRLAQFVIAASVGLVFVLTGHWKRKRHAKWWWLTSFLFLLLSLGSFFSYQHLTAMWTCNYFGSQVVIGSEKTPAGDEYISDFPGTSCEKLIRVFVGQTDDIWTKRSIDGNRLKLAGTYILCMPLFTICIISLLHSLAVSQENREP